jgi:hypothetical protein
VPDAGKKKLFFSMSVHGNERGGLEGGLRAVEDLAIAVRQDDGKIKLRQTFKPAASGAAGGAERYPGGVSLRANAGRKFIWALLS